MIGIGVRQNRIGFGGATGFENQYSMEFDGVDDTIDVGTASLGITTAISISVWVKIPVTNTSPVTQVIVNEDTAGGSARNWTIQWRDPTSSPYIRGIVMHTSGSSVVTTGVVTVNDGNWHHIMMTFDGTTDANGLKLYFDGTLSQTTAGSTGIRSTASVEPAIGSLTAGAGWFLNANIDEVSVFDAVKVLTDVNVDSKPIDLTGESDLVAWWRMGDGVTNFPTIPDQSGNGHDGTANNMDAGDIVEDVP